MDLPYKDIDDLKSRYEFTDLQSFLDLYFANMAVLRTAEDFADLTRAYFRRALPPASRMPSSSSIHRRTWSVVFR